jgi:glycosyltransferase involved in cell wall biosynthesis
MAEQGAEINLLTYGEGEDVEIPGVRHIRIPHPPFLPPVGIGPSLSKLLLDVVMVGVFLRRVATEKYDVVHAHEEAVFFAALFKPMFDYRLVYDMHSSLPQQLGNFEFSRSPLLLRVFDWFERMSLRRADAVVTVCPDLAIHAEGRMPDPERQIMIENTRFEPIRRARRTLAAESAVRGDSAFTDFPADRRIIFYAGSFEPYQGLDRLVEAFAMVHDENPDAMLVLAGGFPQQIAALRRLARDLGFADDVLLPGSIPQVTVRRLLPMAEVLVSSRISGNNTPLKIYEQLASGVPLVATRIRAHTQVLDESVAFLVDRSPEALAEGLRRALSDTEEAGRRARAARDRATRDYSLEAFRGKTADLIERLR